MLLMCFVSAVNKLHNAAPLDCSSTGIWTCFIQLKHTINCLPLRVKHQNAFLHFKFFFQPYASPFFSVIHLSSSGALFVVCSHSWLINDNSFSASSNFHLSTFADTSPFGCLLDFFKLIKIFCPYSHFIGISKGVQFIIFNYNPFYLFLYRNKTIMT